MLKEQPIDDVTVQAIEKCINCRIPFACYLRADGGCVNFYADTSAVSLSAEAVDNFEGFLITTYGLGREKQFYGISRQLTVSQVLALRQCQPLANSTPARDMASTPKEQYLTDVENIVSSLSGDDEKAVYARQKVIVSEMRATDVANLYFGAHPHCFRFLYYTPYTGLWLGASPELLVDIDRTTTTLSTMALAGTRSVDDSSDWTHKNRLEHDIVVRFICNTLLHTGAQPFCSPTTICRFGQVEHLCTPIRAISVAPLSKLLYLLSPTPALCGWPVGKAASLISEHEQFDRVCYGGAIGECTSQRTLMYVNLRSMEIYSGCPTVYRLIAGGGITVNSVAEEEWAETCNKMKSITDIILPVSITENEVFQNQA